MKNLMVRAIFFFIGLLVLSLGVSLTIKADLGTGAWDAINVSLSQITGLTVGNWVMIIGVILLVVNAIIAMEKPDFMSLITVFIIGLLIDFWLLIILNNWAPQSLFIQIITLIIGVVILGFGVALYLQPNLSINPVDGVMVALQKRFGFSLLIGKTIAETFALVIALLLGGPIGIGTFIILLLIGPTIQFFEPTAKKLLAHFDRDPNLRQN